VSGQTCPRARGPAQRCTWSQGCSLANTQSRRAPSTISLLESAKMKQLLVRFVREDEGQDLVEYALLITFIALACIIGMQQLGTAINNKYNSISSSLS
jgi:pilus assembly protein Flp/PilA